MKYIAVVGLTVFMLSCGSYKRTSTETNEQKDVTAWQKQQNDKVVLETVTTTIEGFEPLEIDGNLQPTPKQWTLNQTKTTKTVDKGTLEQESVDKSSVKVEDETKQNPWRPPWYVSGLAVMALLVVYKVFKAKFQIVKRIKEL